MWIMTVNGFYSVVQKPEDKAAGLLTIRARQRADLETLSSRYLPDAGEIIESTESDYRYRIVVSQASMASAMAAITADIDYANFKSVVAERQGHERADVYNSVWLDLLTLQKMEERSTAQTPPIGIDAYPSHGSHSRRRP